jgi:hypothetical protein
MPNLSVVNPSGAWMIWSRLLLEYIFQMLHWPLKNVKWQLYHWIFVLISFSFLITTAKARVSNSYWTSFTRRANCDPIVRWCYDNGEPLNAAKIPWYSGQPDNYGGNEYCGDIWLRNDQSTGMNDRACDSASPVVACQVNVYHIFMLVEKHVF